MRKSPPWRASGAPAAFPTSFRPTARTLSMAERCLSPAAFPSPARACTYSPLQMMEAAMDHDGFGVIECLSECVEFFEGAFDASNPRKGGVFNSVPADHDVTDEMAAYKLADTPFPGHFGVFYKVNRPTKNALEAKINATVQEKVKGLKDWEILQKSFNQMK